MHIGSTKWNGCKWKTKWKRSIQWDIKPYTNERGRRRWRRRGPRAGAPGPGDPPPPPPSYPFICLWFDVSLYWSFSLRFLFVYISFCASNVYSTYILVIISIIWLLCFIFTSWYSKKGAYLTFLAVGWSRPTHKIEFPTSFFQDEKTTRVQSK